LAAMSCLFMVLGCRPVGGHLSDMKRIKFEAFKLVVVFWGFFMSCKSKPRFTVDSIKATDSAYKDFTLRASRSLASGTSNFVRSGFKRRWAKILVFALPAVLLFYTVVITILVFHTQLVLYVIYVWGDCLNLHKQDASCRDPQLKHGVWLGLPVEIGLDVLLAIIFELIFESGKGLAHCIATMQEYKYASDYNFFVNMLSVALAVIDRVGFVSVLAFLYVPQWAEPKSLLDPVSEGLATTCTSGCRSLGTAATGACRSGCQWSIGAGSWGS